MAFDYTLLEDGQGTLHLISFEALSPYHRILAPNGAWSQPQQITGENFFGNYWVGVTPEGCPCVVWADMEISYAAETRGARVHVLRVLLFRDGKWQKQPETYDFMGENGMDMSDFELLDVAFDALGEPHFFYRATQGPPGVGLLDDDVMAVSGFFVDGRQLTECDIYPYRIAEQKPEPVERSVVKGVGDMCEPVRFYIDGENVYHLLYCDENSRIDSGGGVCFKNYCHSFSRDGGATWEGPAQVFENEPTITESGQRIPKSIEDVFVDEDKSGNLRITVLYDKFAQPQVRVTTLNHDTFEPDISDGWFGDKQTTEALELTPIDEVSVYHGMEFQTVVTDPAGRLHFITNGVSAEYWDISHVEGNVWLLRDIEKPMKNATLVAVYMRSNGNLVLLANDYGELLFYAEITPAR